MAGTGKGNFATGGCGQPRLPTSAAPLWSTIRPTTSSWTTPSSAVLMGHASASLLPRTAYGLAALRGSMPTWPQGRGSTHVRHHHEARVLRELVPAQYTSVHVPPSAAAGAWAPSSPAVAASRSLIPSGVSSVAMMRGSIPLEQMMRSSLLSAAEARQAPPLVHTQPAAIPAAGSFAQTMGRCVVESGLTFLLKRGLADQTTEGVIAPHVLADIGITTMVDLADSFADEMEVRAATRSAAQTAQDLAVQAWAQCKRRAPQLARLRAAQKAKPAPASASLSSSLAAATSSTSSSLARVPSVPITAPPTHPIPPATPMPRRPEAQTGLISRIGIELSREPSKGTSTNWWMSFMTWVPRGQCGKRWKQTTSKISVGCCLRGLRGYQCLT